MASGQRRIVVDANILIRLVLGRRVRELVLDHLGQVRYFTPDVAYADARTYLPDLLQRRGIDPATALAVLDRFAPIIHPVEAAAYNPARPAALARIKNRDPNDWPVVAVALILDSPIWTEDQDFFGTGIPTWTTDRVQLYLDGPAQS